MRFEWDENKRRENIRRHGIDFVGGESIFENETFTFEDARIHYGEQRLITLGLFDGRAVVVVHTESVNVIRIISIRKATNYEQELFFQNTAYPKKPD